jgi:hypothetical protein
MNVKAERRCFYILLFACILPIWVTKYFLTGDGPCHLYTSGILLSWMKGENVDMYSNFMMLNPRVDPNWLTNIIQVPLLVLFPPAIAEKIFFTLYIGVFGFGFRFLLKQINPNALFLSVMGLIFAWHHIAIKGFLNNTFSLAIWFWIVGCWLKYQDAPAWKAILSLMLLSFLAYFSHPIGYIYSGLMIVCILLVWCIVCLKEQGWKAALRLFAVQVSRLTLAFLPSLILMIIFFTRRTWSAEPVDPTNNVWINLLELRALLLFHSNELFLTKIVSGACLLLFLVTLVMKVCSFRLRKYDGVILFSLLVFYSIINPPSGMLGGLAIDNRLIILPYIAIVFSAASIDNFKIIKPVVLVFSSLVMLSLLIIRVPIHMKLSDYAEEIVDCKDKIKPRSTLMTINYDLNPHDVHGKDMINATWVNTHTDCYIGVYKPVVVADHYELNFDYFPFLGIADRNFYYKSMKNEGMFEGMTPIADFNGYYEKTGVQIRYVILCGLDKEKRKEPYVQDVLAQLESGYKKIYTSPNGVAVLYEAAHQIKQPWESN